MLKGVDVSTTRAVPCALLRVGIARVKHLHNQMAVQAHGRFTVNIFGFHSFSHNSPLVFFMQFRFLVFSAAESTRRSVFVRLAWRVSGRNSS